MLVCVEVCAGFINRLIGPFALHVQRQMMLTMETNEVNAVVACSLSTVCCFSEEGDAIIMFGLRFVWRCVSRIFNRLCFENTSRISAYSLRGVIFMHIGKVNVLTGGGLGSSYALWLQHIYM